MKRRTLLAASAAVATPALVRAQSLPWPGNRQVRIVITYPPGGTSDFVARLFAQRLSDQTGASFVVENRSGGNGVVGWTNVVRSAPDVPTVREQGFDFTYSFWYGMLGPKGMEPALVTRIQEEIGKVLAAPDVRDRFAQQGASVMSLSLIHI